VNAIHEAMNDVPNGFDLLRIIAQDNKSKLSVQDHVTLTQCADEWETHMRQLVAVYQQLLDTHAQRVAAGERLIELELIKSSIDSEGTKYHG
jgi:hypothetical protein